MSILAWNPCFLCTRNPSSTAFPFLSLSMFVLLQFPEAMQWEDYNNMTFLLLLCYLEWGPTLHEIHYWHKHKQGPHVISLNSLYTIYLLLHNKLPQKLTVLKNNKCFVVYHKAFVGQGQEQPRWVFKLEVSQEVAFKIKAHVAIIWRLDWGWLNYFQGGSLTWLASWCWLLIRGLTFSPCGPLQKTDQFLMG